MPGPAAGTIPTTCSLAGWATAYPRAEPQDDAHAQRAVFLHVDVVPDGGSLDLQRRHAKLDPFTLNVLCNAEVIDVDQDALGHQARIIRCTSGDFILLKDLEDGSKALGLLNLGETEGTISVAWSELGLSGAAAGPRSVAAKRPALGRRQALRHGAPPRGAACEAAAGVQVTAFGPNPDGEGIILRFWEQAGQDGVCTVKLPEALRSHKARLCNLRGEPSPEPIQVRSGSLNVPLTHFAPTSVLLTR